MSELPQGWTTTTLAESGEWIGGGTPSKSKAAFWTDGSIPWVSPKDMKRLRIDNAEDHITDAAVAGSSVKPVPKGAVMVVTRSGILAHSVPVAIADVDVTVNQDLKAIAPYKAVDSEYLLLSLRALEDHFLSTCRKHGTTVASLDTDRLKKTDLPLPPLPEQRRIVAKLDRLSARSAAARDQLARTTKLATRAKQAILTRAFRGGVSSKDHGDYGDRKDIDTPFAIPTSWSWKTAEELCEWITKGTTPKRDEQHAGNGDVPFIKVYNLTFDGSLDFTKEPTFVGRQIHDGFLKRSKVFPGDILMNIVGPPLGKVAIVPDTHPEWNMNQAIAVFRAKDEILPAFLAKWLLSEAYLSWATALSKATAGQRNLTLEICRRSPVPVPPLDEQREIVRRIEAAFARIDRMTEEASRGAHLLDRLDERLLAKAFRGELVPQDPEDEPAEALLTRIREARAAAPKVKRGRKAKL
ncbi:restriction endonuclease subunit S [Salipiger bermudensis]|uniref:restriction endonuclease subunit S n=1 Tax=Salipiger bermudensis TaxID=344736 RepID=UPI001A8D7705|nr:restriction endonuclease subunit S [Salipiger bermudensis]MBN9674123.1 restriction endonuclease subunit S [Salipiger bermudensis]